MKEENTYAYADTDTLVGWKGEIESINDSAIQVLDSIKSTIADLENYWKGNSAKGFVNASNKLLDQGKKCHGNMNEVSRFLINVANTMENQ